MPLPSEPRPSTGAPVRGNWATLLLPIGENDEIDLARLAEELDALTSAGVDGIYSNGTAGEFHNQTEAEFDAIQILLAERARRAGTSFVIGACQPDPRIQLDRVRRAAPLRPAAIQVILPDWWPVTNEEAADVLKAAAEAADGVPLVLYNPPHAKRVLSPLDLALVTAGIPAVIGAKLGGGDAAWHALAREHLTHLALFVPGHRLATGVREGVAAGAFSNVACLSPAGAQAWTARMAADLDWALDVEARLAGFMEDHIVPFRRDHGFSNAALDKLLAAIGAWAPVGPRLRSPYRWIPTPEADRLRPIARAMLPEIMNA